MNFTGAGKEIITIYDTDETHSEIESNYDESKYVTDLIDREMENLCDVGSSEENPITIDDSDNDEVEETKKEVKNKWLDAILGDNDQESDADRDFIDDSELDPNFTNEDFLRNWNKIPDISAELNINKKQIDKEKLINDLVEIKIEKRKNLTAEEVEKIRLEVTEELNKQIEMPKKRCEYLNKRLQILVDIENIGKIKKSEVKKATPKKQETQKKSKKAKKSTPVKPKKFKKFAKVPK